MRLLALFVCLVLVPACRGNDFGNPGGDPGGGGGGFQTPKKPDLVISDLEVLATAPGPLGTTAVQLRIQVANLKPNKPFGLPVQKPFQVSIVVTNTAFVDEDDKDGNPIRRGLAVPVGFGIMGTPGNLELEDGLDQGPIDGPSLFPPPSDLTITGPINAGEYVEVVRTAFLRIPWAPGTASMQIRATADWTDVVGERNETNNEFSIPFGS